VGRLVPIASGCEYPAVTPRHIRGLAIASAAVSLAMLVAATVFLVLAWRSPLTPSEFGVKGYGHVFATAFAGLGLVLALRVPRNATGWIFSGVGVVAATMALTAEYARWALELRARTDMLAITAAWVQEWLWIALVLALSVTAAIFPDGRFPSRASQRIVLALAALGVVPIVTNALIPELTIFAGRENPFGVGGASMQTAAPASIALILPLTVAGMWIVVRRFRRARGEERQQMKWLVVSAGLLASVFVIYVLILVVRGTEVVSRGMGLEWLEYLAIVAFLGIPISIALGVLKYGLYEIDVVINKAVLYGGLAASITLIYVAVVAGAGAVIGDVGSTALSAAAAAVIAVVFQPLRRRAQRLANRIVYGDRATPYEVLADLGERMESGYATDDVLQRVASVLGPAIGAERVDVWIRADGALHPAAGWPTERARHQVPLHGDRVPPKVDDERLFPVRHLGEPLGAIGVRKPVTDPIGPADERLVTDIAAQSGVVMRNVRLIEDLRASRRRLVEAQDHERRKIERNLHDGAQQQLIALQVQLKLLDRIADDPTKVRSTRAALTSALGDAIDELRALARGIYPPLLADHGLVAAVEAQARRAAVPTTVEADGVGRYPQEVEAAVYFCVLEALQNIGKYAGASAVTATLNASDRDVSFVVRDDGRGFDPSQTGEGSGIRGMRDRLDALGGTLEVTSEPGLGTTVKGTVPVNHTAV
jgi:signal transduction histidine kinase